MKFFTLLFNIYLLALSFFPCADVDSCEDDSIHVSVATNNPNKEDHKESEDCTPFCICACCAVPIIYQSVSMKEVPQQIHLEVKYPSLNIKYPSHNAASIWQPPKFC